MGAPKGKILINVNDIIGKRVGKLKILEYAGYNYDMTLGGVRVRHFYRCECDCGRPHITHRDSLLGGIVNSCGCLRRKRK